MRRPQKRARFCGWRPRGQSGASGFPGVPIANHNRPQHIIRDYRRRVDADALRFANCNRMSAKRVHQCGTDIQDVFTPPFLA